MSPKTPFNTLDKFNDRPMSSNNGFHKKKEQVLKETEAIFSDEDEVVDLEAELRQKLKDEKISSFHTKGHLEDDFEF